MAVESFADVATEVAKHLLYGTRREVSYFFCFNNIVKEHENEMEHLVERRDYVLECAREAKRNLQIRDDAQRWLSRAENLIDELPRLEDVRRAKSKCFMGWSPNCIWQYLLGKKMAERKEIATKLIDESRSMNFQRLATLRNMEYYSLKDFVDLQSRELTCNKLLEALKDEQSSTVGLYGMVGSGKTTLVKQVGKQVEAWKLFDEVVLTVVSDSPDIRRIQGEIADQLGLRLEGETESYRAKRLWSRLTTGEKILIILDDVWRNLDLEAIGIPHTGSRQHGCKVLLTAQSADVCYYMNCQPVILLSSLSDEDAWILFQKCASINDESPEELKHVAKKIAIQCKGLPVVIASIASTLKKSQSIQDWNNTLRSVEDSGRLIDISEDLGGVIGRMMANYESLNEKAQSLFKLCFLFPNEYEIPLEDLTRYGIGLGLFGDIDRKSYEILRDQVYKVRMKLLDSCFLQNVKGEFVIINGFFHQLVHYITNEEIQVILGPVMELKAPESVKFLWFHNIVEFPCQLNCPNLKILVINIQWGNQSLEVTDTLFKDMEDLRVLTLTWKKLWYWEMKQISIPQSIQFLINLRRLRLNHWLLGDISVLGSLEKLETLEFNGCSMEELPTAFLGLKKLRLLSLISCLVDKNPFAVMGRFSQLEELYFRKTKGSQWKVDGENVSEFLDINYQWARLERYQMEIGANLVLYNSVKKTEKRKRALSVERFDASTSNGTIKDLIRRAEVLHLQDVQGGLRSVIPNLVEVVDGLNELIQLRLDGCHNIECLIDDAFGSSQVGTIFSNLVKLKLKCMDDFKQLCQGHPPSNIFEKLEKLHLNRCSQLNNILFVGNLNLCNLKVLKVKACPALTSLFTLSIAQSLVLLEELYLVDCRELKYIIVKEKDDYCEESILPSLRIFKIKVAPNYASNFASKGHSIDGSLPLESTGLELTASTILASQYKNSEEGLLPIPIALRCSWQGLNLCRLREMMLTSIPSLVSLFTPSTAQTMSMLESLRIENCEGLKHIMTNIEDQDYNNHGSMSVFPTLKELFVKKCDLLNFIFPAFFAHGLVKLRILQVKNCAMLEYVFGEYPDNGQLRNRNEDEIQTHVELPALEKLTLKRLPKIINICPNYYSPIWPSLKEMRMEKCAHELTLTSITDCITKESQAVQSLHNLLNLEILSLDECLNERIFQFKGLTDGPHYPLTSRLEELYFTNLPELRHICNGPMLLSFQNLRELQFWGCGKLVAIFSVYVFRRLQQLCSLRIEKCDEVKHITEENEGQVLLNGSSQEVCFPNLETIVIRQCNKLQYLFSICNPNELPKLYYLKINEASQIEQVFRRRMGNTEDRDNPVLPALETLKLNDLPCLFNVCDGFKLRSQIDLRVKNCPQLPHEYQNAGQFSSLAFPEEQGREESKEEKEITMTERNIIELSTGSTKSKEAHMAAAQTSVGDPETALTNSEKATNTAPQIIKTEGHSSNFPTGIIAATESTFKLPKWFDNNDSFNGTKVSCIEEKGNQEREEDIEVTVKERNVIKLRGSAESKEANVAVAQTSVKHQETSVLINSEKATNATPQSTTNKEAQAIKEAFSKGQGSHEAEEEEDEVTVKERHVIELSKDSAESKEAHMTAAQTSFVDSKTILTNLVEATYAASQTTKINEGIDLNEVENRSSGSNVVTFSFSLTNHPSNFSSGIIATESTFELIQQLNDSDNINIRVNHMDKGSQEREEEIEVTVKERNVIKRSSGFAESKEAKMAVAQASAKDPETVLISSEKVTNAAPQTTTDEEVEKGKEAINEDEQEKKGEDVIVQDKGFVESKEADVEVEQTTAPFIDDNSSQTMETKIAIHQDKIKQRSGTALTKRMEGRDIASSETSTSNIPKKTNDIILDQAKHGGSLKKDSQSEHHSDHFNYKVACSGGAPRELPVEEYADFKDIGPIKKKHIPLLEQAIENYPFLWTRSQKFKRPQTKRSIYTILGDLLEFLASTRWSDLNEEKKVEFEYLVNDLEALGFDIQWLASTYTMIMQTKIDEDTISHVKSLEAEVKSKEIIVDYLKVSLQESEAELHERKMELDDLKAKLGNINDFIGF